MESLGFRVSMESLGFRVSVAPEITTSGYLHVTQTREASQLQALLEAADALTFKEPR